MKLGRKQPKTFNRSQCVALFSLAMHLGMECEVTVLTTYTVGNVLVEARVGPETYQYMLPVEGGFEEVLPIREEATSL
jgi:hypothetical protein